MINFNAKGQVIETLSPKLESTKYRYDANGDLNLVTMPDGLKAEKLDNGDWHITGAGKDEIWRATMSVDQETGALRKVASDRGSR